MKGRNNYVCLNRAAEIRQDLFSFLDDEEIEQFDHITRMARSHRRREPFRPRFCSQGRPLGEDKLGSETCLGGACGLFGRCFVNRVKRRAISAHLVVTNHHYLLADASLARSGSSILPAYERIVLDEAHNLEDSASSFFTKTVTRAGILRLLGRLYSDGKRKRGYLAFLEKQGFCEGEERHERLRREVQRVKSSAGELFDGIEDLLAALGRSGGGPEGLPGGSSFGPHPVAEMGDELLEHPLWESGVSRFLMACRADIGNLAGSLIELMELLERKGEERAQKQLGGFVARLGDIVKAFDIFTRRNDPAGTGRSGDGSNGAGNEDAGGGQEQVRHGDDGWDEAAPSGRGEYARWLEKRKDAALVVSLVDVGAMLKNLLFKRAKSTVLTSATLAVGGSFRFIRSRLALDGEADEAVLPSPFQYDLQMGILIPTDTVGPDHPGYVPAMASGVVQVLKKTQGKAFVLFTSYRTLNEVFEMAKGELVYCGFRDVQAGERLPDEPPRPVQARHPLHPLRDGELLGGGRRPRRGPRMRDHHQAPIQGSDGACRKREARENKGDGGRPVPRVQSPPSRDEDETGDGEAHPKQDRQGYRGDPRQKDTDKEVRRGFSSKPCRAGSSSRGRLRGYSRRAGSICLCSRRIYSLTNSS